MPAYTLSYGVAAAAYLCLLCWVLGASSRSGNDSKLPAIAAAGTALSSFVYACAGPSIVNTWPLAAPIAWASSASWLVLLLSLSGGMPARRHQQLMLASIWVLLAALSSLFAYLELLLRLCAALLGMMLVEHLFRTTPPTKRWSIKFICLGTGVMFAYDFYLYSDALLLRRMDAEFWSARGGLLAICAVPLAIAYRRNPLPPVHWRLSRQLLLGSVTLLGASVYLLLVSACAWYLRAVGGPWGVLMQLICLGGALLLLLATLFSGAARAWLRVWIARHFYRGHYDYRQEWQLLTAQLSAGEVSLHERVVRSLAHLLESPAGVLWLASAHGQFRIAHCWNMAAPDIEFEPDAGACQLMSSRGWVLDGRAQGWKQLYCAVPLRFESQLVGIVGLASPRVELALDWERRDILKIAGQQAASYLAQAAAAGKLTIARQFESVHRMATFIAHDMRNVTSQLSLLATNAQRYHGEAEFQQDMQATLTHSVTRMQQLMAKLRQATALGPDVQAASPLLQRVLLEEVVAETLAGFVLARPRPTFRVEAGGLYVLAQRERLLRVIAHLVQNAVEATPAEGTIELSLARKAAFATLTISDSGCGMTQHFVNERLFQPFASGKAAGMGVGSYESWEYAGELGGKLEVRSSPGRGSSFYLTLPLHLQAAAA